MTLKELVNGISCEVIQGDTDKEVNSLVYDSRKAGKSDVFVCISGAVSDGHSYVRQVIEAGVSAIIIEKDVELPKNTDVCVIKTPDTRYALALMSAAYFDYPAKKLFTIGITGTKGKTTTSFMVRNMLEACGFKTGLIGTIETIIGEEHITSVNTTPESYVLQEYFYRMAESGCKCVVMEVSSQALKLHRTAGIMFDIGVFTNLEPDHIGPNEHESMEEYIECKSRLFKQCKTGIVNSDSDYLEQVLKNHTCEIESYGIKNNADYRAENIQYVHKNGNIATEYNITGKHEMNIDLRLPGEFSVYNSLCAVAITKHLNTDDKLISGALKNVRVTGRVEPVKVSDDFTVMIDYAHNAMSLESLLKTLKEYNPKRIITVFGCGGNRSAQRRFEMGEISGKMSDFTVITSDNPRFENPDDIMKDIETGIKRTAGKYIKIADRAAAVKYAIDNAMTGDIIVIAGKGHEDYQEIEGIKYHMNDRELILQAVSQEK